MIFFQFCLFNYVLLGGAFLKQPSRDRKGADWKEAFRSEAEEWRREPEPWIARYERGGRFWRGSERGKSCVLQRGKIRGKCSVLRKRKILIMEKSSWSIYGNVKIIV